jgi:hypothetical protein
MQIKKPGEWLRRCEKQEKSDGRATAAICRI